MHIVDSRRATAHNTKFRFDSLKYGLHWRSFFFKFVAKNILYASVFKKKDSRTIYNMIYKDGKTGVSYIKRFNVTGVTRDKLYNLTSDHPKSKVLHWHLADKYLD